MPAAGRGFLCLCQYHGHPFTAHEFQEKLLEEYGVACIAGTSFGGFGEGYVRLSCANSDEAIEEAVSRIDKMLSDSA